MKRGKKFDKKCWAYSFTAYCGSRGKKKTLMNLIQYNLKGTNDAHFGFRREEHDFRKRVLSQRLGTRIAEQSGDRHPSRRIFNKRQRYFTALPEPAEPTTTATADAGSG